MIAKSHPGTSDNKKKTNNKWKWMNCLNYEPSQNLNRMNTYKQKRLR